MSPTRMSELGTGFTRAFPQAETSARFPAAVHDLLALDALLTPEEKALRDKIRAFAVSGDPPASGGARHARPCAPPCAAARPYARSTAACRRRRWRP